jgi:hypothetical protein
VSAIAYVSENIFHQDLKNADPPGKRTLAFLMQGGNKISRKKSD